MANVDTWTPIRSDTFMQIMAQAITRKNKGYFVMSGCDVHQAASPDMTVVIDAGYVMYGNTYTAVAGNAPTLTSDPSLPRFYTIYVDGSGVAQAYQGAAAAISPSGETAFRKMEAPFPGDTCPTGVPLSIVYLAAGATSILNAVIFDISAWGGGMSAASHTFSATARILGRKTASSGVGEECSLSEVLDFIGSPARGDFLARGASTWARFAGVEQGSICYEGANLDPGWLLHGNYGDRVCSGGHGANPFMAGADGWIPATETWTYVSGDVSAFTYVFKITGVDVTSKMWVGMKLKCTDAAAVKYFVITAIAFSTDTTVTVFGGSDYTLAGGAITNPFYSHVKCPSGFPMAISKWSCVIADATGTTINDPVSSTWYNATNCNLEIPIGLWNVSYHIYISNYNEVTLQCNARITLSTANNSESNSYYTSAIVMFGVATGGSYCLIGGTVFNSFQVSMAAPTIHYINFYTTSGGVNTHLYCNISSGPGPGWLLAECAYI